jgi:O-antigen/teichoic acid export membrane protein
MGEEVVATTHEGLGRHGRNLIWLAGAELVTKALAIFYFAYLTRQFSRTDNLWYGMYVSFFPILVVLNTMGFQDVVGRDVAQRSTRMSELLSSALVIQTALLGMLLPAIWGLGHALNYEPPLRLILMLSAAGAYIWSVNSLHEGVLVAHERFKYISVVNLLARTLVAAGGVALVYRGYGAVSVVAYFIPVSLLQLACMFMFVRRATGGYRFRPTRTEALRLVRHGVPMAGGRFTASAYYRIDLPLLEALALPAVSEFYAIGIRFFTLLTTLPNTLETLFYPVLSRRAIQDAAAQQFALERFLHFMAVIAMPIAAGMAVLGRDIIVALCGIEWAPSTPAAMVLTWVICFAMIDRAFVVFLRARARQHLLVYVYAAALALKTGLGYLAIQAYSDRGLFALNIALSAGMAAALALITVRLVVGFTLWRFARLLARPAFAAAVMAAALAFVRGQFIGFTVPLGAAIYFAVLYIIGGIDAFDRQLVRSTLLGRKP